MTTIKTPPNGAPNGKRESKVVTIADVAKAAGVGRTTVSLVFNDKGHISQATREAVRRAAQELGFEPNPHAQRLASGRCDKTVGLFSMDFDLSVGARKIKDIQRALICQGWHVPVYLGSYDNESDKVALLRALRGQRPRAIVCHTMDLPPQALDELQRFQDEGGVAICYDYPVEASCDQVVFDRDDNTYQAARHVLEHGHRDVGLCVIGRKLAGPRFCGFERALNEFGAILRPEWLLDTRGSGEFEEYGVEAAHWFLNLRERPTAMCIVNDEVAQAFIYELMQAGVRVPQDLSVVGHDDRPIARHGLVALSSVSHPVGEIVDQVVTLLTNRLSGDESEARRVVLRGQITPRASVAPPSH